MRHDRLYHHADAQLPVLSSAPREAGVGSAKRLQAPVRPSSPERKPQARRHRLQRIRSRLEPVRTPRRFDTARLPADTGPHSAWKRRIEEVPEPPRPEGSLCCSTRSTRNSNRCYEHQLRNRLAHYLWTDQRNSFRNWYRCRRSHRSSPQGCRAREVRLAVRFRSRAAWSTVARRSERRLILRCDAVILPRPFCVRAPDQGTRDERALARQQGVISLRIAS